MRRILVTTLGLGFLALASSAIAASPDGPKKTEAKARVEKQTQPTKAQPGLLDRAISFASKTMSDFATAASHTFVLRPEGDTSSCNSGQRRCNELPADPTDPNFIPEPGPCLAVEYQLPW